MMMPESDDLGFEGLVILFLVVAVFIGLVVTAFTESRHNSNSEAHSDEHAAYYVCEP